MSHMHARHGPAPRRALRMCNWHLIQAAYCIRHPLSHSLVIADERAARPSRSMYTPHLQVAASHGTGAAAPPVTSHEKDHGQKVTLFIVTQR